MAEMCADLGCRFGSGSSVCLGSHDALRDDFFVGKLGLLASSGLPTELERQVFGRQPGPGPGGPGS